MYCTVLCTLYCTLYCTVLCIVLCTVLCVVLCTVLCIGETQHYQCDSSIHNRDLCVPHKQMHQVEKFLPRISLHLSTRATTIKAFSSLKGPRRTRNDLGLPTEEIRSKGRFGKHVVRCYEVELQVEATNDGALRRL